MAKADKKDTEAAAAPVAQEHPAVDPTAPVRTTGAPHFAENIPADLGGEEQEVNALATRQTTALLADPAHFDLDVSGVRPPFLTITHGVGEASTKFNPGDLILAKDTLVLKADKQAQVKPSMTVIILNIGQYYKERVSKEDWDAGVRPRTFKDAKEAAAAGLNMNWRDEGGKRVGPDASAAMDLVLLIQKPKDITSGLFAIDIGDGNEYALALFPCDKKCYEYVINDIGNTVKHKLAKTGCYSASWTMWTELSKVTKYTNNQVQVARFRFNGMLDPKIVDAIKSVLAAPGNG